MHERELSQQLTERIRDLYNGTNVINNLQNYGGGNTLINKGLHQGRSLSPTLFDAYLDATLPTGEKDDKLGKFTKK
jgi:hypothetical protein